MMHRTIKRFLLPFLIVAITIPLKSQTNYYVNINDPNANDSNPGTKTQPFATLERARDVVRQLKKSDTINIIIREGSYHLSEPLILKPYDSGTEESPVIWRAAKNERVVISGGKEIDGTWYVHLVGGTVPTQIKLFDWIREVEQRGAGEILFTSMNHDGTKNGFANKALAEASGLVSIPIIASGGAGKMSHFRDTFKEGLADAALAASVFHYHEIDIPELKSYLKQENIAVRS